MSTHSTPFPFNALRMAVWTAALLLALDCGDSTAPPTGTKYLVTSSLSNPVAGDSVVIRAQLVDAEDHPVRLSGRVVNWISDAGRGRVNPGSSLTSTEGIASTFYITDTTAGLVQKVLAVDVNGLSGLSSDINPVSGPPAKYNVFPSTLSPEVGSAIVVSAQLTDAHSNVAKVSGRVVSWSASFSGPGSGSFSSPTSTTNADGIATVTFTIGTSSNVSYNVAVLDDHQAGGSSLPFTSQPSTAAKYVVSASVVDPPAGAGVLISAQASDAYGNPSVVSGRVITWSKTGPGGSLSAQTAATNEDGYAAVVLTTSSIVGSTYTVSAVDANGFSGTSGSITTMQQISLESVSAGFGAMSTCGIASDGRAWCWGANDFGGLGNGTTLDRSLPGKVSISQTITSLSAGLSHACGIANGVVHCWGNNTDGQLGDGTTSSRSSPAPINSSLSFTAVSAGTAHTCAIASGGDAYCWGLRASYRLGDGGASSSAPTPVKVSGGLSFVTISAGVDHTCGITSGGDAYCWGVNSFGKLGENSVTPAGTPRAVVGGLKFTSITVGESHTCGISGGNAYCWGSNQYGQLGVQPAPQKTTPTAVSGGLTFAQISAGGFHTCGIASDGQAYCWGDNTSGQLGTSANVTASGAPVVVAGGLTFKSISVGGGMIASDDYYYYYYSSPAGHSCGVTTAGVTYCWGSNNRGELGVGPSYAQSATPIKLAGQP